MCVGADNKYEIQYPANSLSIALMSGPQDVYSFLLYAHQEVEHAKFIGNSIPNVDNFAVERSVRILHAIHSVLCTITGLLEVEITQLQDITVEAAAPLVQHQESPEPARNVGTEYKHTGRPGRPRYSLDIEHAIALHILGCSWDSIADALGVTRKTLYNHLDRAGVSNVRRAYTEISDDNLDGLVAAICIHHPLAGASIVKGHLDSEEVYVPILRIRESLQRVDTVGVYVR